MIFLVSCAPYVTGDFLKSFYIISIYLNLRRFLLHQGKFIKQVVVLVRSPIMKWSHIHSLVFVDATYHDKRDLWRSIRTLGCSYICKCKHMRCVDIPWLLLIFLQEFQFCSLYTPRPLCSKILCRERSFKPIVEQLEISLSLDCSTPSLII